MKWVTREHAHVDRIACPWLIKRFVDEDAEFLFVPPDRVFDVAKEQGAIPFDVKDAELGHRGQFCSFDAIIKKYELRDAGLLEMARIVRGADTKAHELAPEAAGLNSIATGFRLTCRDDFDNMQRQFPMYDALYAFCNREARQDG